MRQFAGLLIRYEPKPLLSLTLSGEDSERVGIRHSAPDFYAESTVLEDGILQLLTKPAGVAKSPAR
jgi:hypothetical protein